MNELYEAVRALPWSAHALVALAMAGGLTLWLTGRALLKPLMVVLCAILGAAAGLAVLTGGATGATLTPAHGLGIGLVIGIVGGLLLYRSAMAIAFGVVMAAVVPLGTAAYFDWRDARDGQTGEVGKESAAAEYVREELASLGARTEAEVDSWDVSLTSLRAPLPRADRIDAPVAAERQATPDAAIDEDGSASPAESTSSLARAFLGAAADEATERWEQRPPVQRTMIMGAAVVGAVAGIAMGLFMPVWGASAVSSMFGAAIWLPCFVWMSTALDAPWRTALDRGPLDWLIVWGGASLAGMTIQWTGVLRRAKKPAA